MHSYSTSFVRFNWISLILIYLVVIAGSFVRITGSGMGCPDWPKCFGQWVPPTSAKALPEDYKSIYISKRAKKIEKFATLLDKTGFKSAANAIRNDKNLLLEQDFNVKKTWTEYVNRLFGFLAGNAVLGVFLWILLFYRKKKLVFISGLNLVLLGIQAWFGSIVVATNLVPWTITVHMLLALVIIGLQLYLIRLVSQKQQQNLSSTPVMRTFIWICFIITAVQMFLGTQVRESIDQLTIQGYERAQWIDMLGMPFYIHRSFSWLVLILIVFLAWKNESGERWSSIRWLFGLLVLELTSGILLAYAHMPGLVQTAHLVFATLLLGILWMQVMRLKAQSA
jgi:cytochrome c oxidase assembly protein subunit 15